jgi:chromosome partition protein MukB
MKANLDACTRTEVQEAQRLEREIGGILARVRDELGKKDARQEVLAAEVNSAEDWLRRLQRAQKAPLRALL